MSPEQIAGDVLATDTRSDVYALGVVAFETLSGRLPHEFKGRSLPDAVRMIAHESPLRLGSVVPACTGDIECIVAKALEKEKERRYASAAEMATDLRRFLADEPILARPPSVAYQIRMFARRNRALVGAAGLVVAILIVATMVSVGQAMRAVRAENDARQQEAEARTAQARAETSAEAATLEAAKLAATNEFLQDIFAAVDPGKPHGDRDVTVTEVLAAAGERLNNGDLAGEPGVEAAARTAIGNAYRALGKPQEGEPHLRRAVELGRSAYPAGHADLAFSMHKLARVYEDEGRYDEAEALYRESLAMRRELLGETHKDVATSLNNLGWLLNLRGDAVGAEALQREALDMRRRLYGDEHVDIATSLNNLASALYAQGRHREAESLYRESLEMDRRLRGPTHANIATTMSNLAVVLQELGQIDEARSTLRDALAAGEAAWGPDHPTVGTFKNNLARLLAAERNFEEAETLYRSAIDLDARARGPDHPNVVSGMTNLAAMLIASGSLDQADVLLDEIMARIAGNPEMPAIRGLYAGYHRAALRLKQERYVEAESIAAGLVSDAIAAMPPGHWITGTMLALRARCLTHLGRTGEARTDYERAREILIATFGEAHKRVVELDAALAELDAEAGG